ncbi:ImmA/IrrE family metallo-endopeptidase [Parvularcula flava]|uniref:ImmA/IrrE family metallo-endopeptidase n=1 Tax=Aquisalinus luteolus TaxID=1566827 RepID=A0A8J3ESW8_9PROT|nr:ImmA/IrrE family metallo-endopeptidase [Aquisalinus luteolus]NHK26379.1 ImmA/IrrE family metallo-endopeptidase [Aquisalinus luteolus]GGH92157.1 hypothetical protein GCM10011355_00990 [Aquisalinus luteolus]
MAVEEAGLDPCAMAQEIHRQIDYQRGHIDAGKVARALDITKISYDALTTYEGALLTNDEHTIGIISVNTNAGVWRRRFTIAHELLHFLNPTHRQTETGFRCTRKDMSAAGPAAGRHYLQEKEANQFAAELLAPRARFDAYMSQAPDISAVVEISQELRISKQVAGRRYQDLHPSPIAMVSAQNGKVIHVRYGDGFPKLDLEIGAALPEEFAVRNCSKSAGSILTYNDQHNRQRENPCLNAQVLKQQEGFSITMLTLKSG